MSPFFQDLKRTREEKRVSLADIADRTLINVKYLEAIEQGNTSILPEAYVRAFIKEYAAAIGLDGAETLRRFDETRRSEKEGARPSEHTAGHAANRTPERSAPPAPPRRPSFSLEPASFLTPRMATIAATVVLVAVGGIVAWNIFSSGSPPPATEIPFQNIVREQEEHVPPPQPQPLPPRRADSLVLSAAVSDTVWMTIVVDSLPSREYIFHRGAKPSWRAGSRFVVTLGNAGAMAFTLNQQQIGTLGRRGNVIRNFALTRQTLAGK